MSSAETTRLRAFGDVYQELSTRLQTLEVQRQGLVSTANRGWLMTLCSLLVGVPVAFGLLSAGPVPAIIMGVITLIGAGIINYYNVIKPGAEYTSLFKDEFMRPIVQSVGLQYSYASALPQELYEASQLFTQGVDRYAGDDLMTGRMGQTDIAMSELHSEYKTTSTNSKGQTQTHWHTIFKGWFVMADFHKRFHGQTFVHPDNAQRMFGFIGQTLQKWGAGSKGELVKLEDPDFEQEFVVYSSDQVEARYILSTSMMQRMLELRKKFDSRVHFSFVDSRVFMAFEISRALFEPEFRTNVLDQSYLRKFYDQLAACLGVVDDLALNLRIWGDTKG